MDNKTKIILTAIGLSAVIIPAVFLFIMSGSKQNQESTGVDSTGRQIDKANIEREINSGQVQITPMPSPSIAASPIPLPSTIPSPITTTESTPSSQ